MGGKLRASGRTGAWREMGGKLPLSYFKASLGVGGLWRIWALWGPVDGVKSTQLRGHLCGEVGHRGLGEEERAWVSHDGRDPWDFCRNGRSAGDK